MTEQSGRARQELGGGDSEVRDGGRSRADGPAGTGETPAGRGNYTWCRVSRADICCYDPDGQ